MVGDGDQRQDPPGGAGAEISPQRDGELIERLIERVKRCGFGFGWPAALLYGWAGQLPDDDQARLPREVATHGARTLPVGPMAGPGSWRKSSNNMKATVSWGSRATSIKGRAPPRAAMIKATQGAGDINTAWIERLNGTFRSCVHSLARRTRALTRTSASLHAGAYLVGTVYNFCTEHESLRLPGLAGGHKWLSRTPAMAAGLTTHCWSVKELLSYRAPPARWRPPKRRGRQSAALKEVIKQWG